MILVERLTDREIWESALVYQPTTKTLEVDGVVYFYVLNQDHYGRNWDVTTSRLAAPLFRLALTFPARFRFWLHLQVFTLWEMGIIADEPWPQTNGASLRALCSFTLRPSVIHKRHGDRLYARIRRYEQQANRDRVRAWKQQEAVWTQQADRIYEEALDRAYGEWDHPRP